MTTIAKQRTDTRPIWLGPDVGKWDHARLHLQLAADERIGLIEIGVFFLLAKHADIHTGECWPSARTLAEQGKAHKDTIRKAVTVLEDAGYLTIVHGKARRANRYYLGTPPVLPNGPQFRSLEVGENANVPKSNQPCPKSDPANVPKSGPEQEPLTRTREQAISDPEHPLPKPWDVGVDKSVGFDQLKAMKAAMRGGVSLPASEPSASTVSEPVA